MDHLLTPTPSVHQLTVVPYLCTEDVDDGPWLTYFHRKGFRAEDLLTAGFWDSRYGLLQNWLYFGPLKAFMGSNYSTKGFLRRSGAESFVIDTSKLKDFTWNWASRWTASPPETQNDIAHIAEKWLESWYCAYQSVQCGDEVGKTIKFSIAVLHEAFYNMLTNIRPKHSLGLLNIRLTANEHFMADFPWNRMLADGWCQRELELLKSLPSSILYYASLSDRPGPQVDHTACSAKRCVAYQIKTTRHAEDRCKCAMIVADGQHISSILLTGSFPIIRMDQNKRGKLPTLKIIPYQPGIQFVALSHVWSDGLGNPSANSLPLCQLKKLTTLLDQTCIDQSRKQACDDFDTSADIRRAFHKMLTKGDGATYLWLDTICCPQEFEFPVSHAKAISRMADVYSQAERVVVLDSYIESFPLTQKRFLRSPKIHKPIALERILRIRCSRWVQRMWTLQEGALAQKLWIRFRDGLFDFERLMHSIIQPTLHLRGEAPTELLSFHAHIRCIKPPEEFAQTTNMMNFLDRDAFLAFARRIERGVSTNDFTSLVNEASAMVSQALARGAEVEAGLTEETRYLQLFARVCKATQDRSLSVGTDEAICLAILLGLDAEEIARTPPAERMQKFWEIQPFYSRSLAHYSGERVKVHGFLWGPETLVDRPNAKDLVMGLSSYSDQPAQRGVFGGLDVSFPGGMILDPLSRALPPLWIFRDENLNRRFLIARQAVEMHLPWPPAIPDLPMKICLMVLGDTDIPHLVETSPTSPTTSNQDFPIHFTARIMILHDFIPGHNTVTLGPIVQVTAFDSKEDNLKAARRVLETSLSLLQDQGGGVNGLTSALTSIFEVDGTWLRGNHKWTVVGAAD